MFKNTPFEAIAKTMSESAPKFTPEAMQEAIRPVQANLMAWAELAQNQAKEAQAVLVEAVESIKGVRDPQAAFGVMKASAEAGMTMFAKNLKDATALSVAQFLDTVEGIEKVHPAPDAFAPVANALKAAATSAEDTLNTTMEKGASMVASATPAAKKKKAA